MRQATQVTSQAPGHVYIVPDGEPRPCSTRTNKAHTPPQLGPTRPLFTPERARLQVAADMADLSGVKSSLNLAYAALLAMLIVPQFYLIHPYMHLLIIAPLLVWTGCQRSLLESQKAPEDSQIETVSKKDAMQFPLIGSAVLFGLYIVVKLIKKEYLDVLISIYFAFLGSFGMFQCVQEPVTEGLGLTKLKKFPVSFNYQFWRAQEAKEPISFSFSLLDVGIFAACAGVSVTYAVTKAWYLNNALGVAFSVQGIELLSLGSFLIGCVLLCGLFVYDVFWVFGTEVMVAVAKGLNAPVKILFPKVRTPRPMPRSRATPHARHAPDAPEQATQEGGRAPLPLARTKSCHGPDEHEPRGVPLQMRFQSSGGSLPRRDRRASAV